MASKYVCESFFVLSYFLTGEICCTIQYLLGLRNIFLSVVYWKVRNHSRYEVQVQSEVGLFQGSLSSTAMDSVDCF